MSRPVSAMMDRARSSLIPGTCASRCTTGSTGSAGAVPASGPVAPSAFTPQAAGIAAAASAIRVVSLAILPSRKAIWSSSNWASSPWCSPNMPSSASTRSSCLAFIFPRAKAASTCGSRSPAISARTMSCADIVVSLLATDESLISASSSSFSSRCQHRVRSWTSRVRSRVYSRSARIAAGGTKLARSSPSSVSRASQIASSLSVLGRPGRFLAWEELTSWTASPHASSAKNQIRQ
jgi:hypothetical protein